MPSPCLPAVVSASLGACTPRASQAEAVVRRKACTERLAPSSVHVVDVQAYIKAALRHDCAALSSPLARAPQH
jgi:hypothetical protein